MSYEIRVTRTADSGDGISVEARIEGEPVAHTFPKGLGFFEEPENGRPPFVDKLVEKYEEKMKREGRLSVQETTAEEAKIHGSHFENTEYGKPSEEGKAENDIMANVDIDDPEQIRSYLKENMAEGYLSEEEGLNIDKFVDEYSQLLQQKENLQEVVRKAYEVKVQ